MERERKNLAMEIAEKQKLLASLVKKENKKEKKLSEEKKVSMRTNIAADSIDDNDDELFYSQNVTQAMLHSTILSSASISSSFETESDRTKPSDENDESFLESDT